MALYHLHVKNISRGDGRSAVAAAAYRAGETLENAAEERLSKFAGRRDVLGAEIHLPADAPAWMGDRATLWNAAEAAERRKDARLAKETEFSIPRELPRADWFTVARAMAAHYTAQGFVVDLAVHDDGTGHNPHVHLMLTTRQVTAAGFGPKLRAADSKTFLKDTRTTWQAIANAALAKAGVSVKIDASSYAARGIEREPGEHRPPDPAARRQRRQEVAAMSITDAELIRVRDELAGEAGVRERYPLLGKQQDWPPGLISPPSLIPNARSREMERFWQEVTTRAEARREEPDLDRTDASSRSMDEEVNDLARKIQAASLKQGVERRQAFVEHAADYERMFRRVNREMVQAGVLRPENVRSWESVSRAFRDEGFDQLLAEARVLEAKRNEPDRTLRATPAMIQALEKHERAEEERREALLATQPVRPAPGVAAAQDRMVQEYEREDMPAAGNRSPARETPPDPFTYLATQPAPRGFEAAQDRMAGEYERDDTRPPDPYEWLKRQTPVAPVAEQDQERERKQDREWER